MSIKPLQESWRKDTCQVNPTLEDLGLLHGDTFKYWHMEDEKPWPLVPSPPESLRPVRLETQESVQTRLGNPGPGWGGQRPSWRWEEIPRFPDSRLLHLCGGDPGREGGRCLGLGLEASELVGCPRSSTRPRPGLETLGLALGAGRVTVWTGWIFPVLPLTRAPRPAGAADPPLGLCQWVSVLGFVRWPKGFPSEAWPYWWPLGPLDPWGWCAACWEPH